MPLVIKGNMGPFLIKKKYVYTNIELAGFYIILTQASATGKEGT